MDRKRLLRISLAFIGAPFLPALVGIQAGFLLTLVGIQAGLLLPSVWAAASTVMMFSPVFAVPATWLLGVPLFIVLSWRGITSFKATLVVGAAVAMAVSLLCAWASFPTPLQDSAESLYFPSRWWGWLGESLIYALVFILFGVVIAGIFWMLAFADLLSTSQQPNQDPKQTDA